MKGYRFFELTGHPHNLIGSIGRGVMAIEVDSLKVCAPAGWVPLTEDDDSPVAYSSMICNHTLRDSARRISEAKARALAPSLFAHLDRITDA